MIKLVPLASEGGWEDRGDGDQTQVGSRVKSDQGPHGGRKVPDEAEPTGMVTDLMRELGKRKCQEMSEMIPVR